MLCMHALVSTVQLRVFSQHLCCCCTCLSQVGALIAELVFGYVDQRTTFLLSAAFGLVGWVFGWLFLPDTTGLSLDELDRWVDRVPVSLVTNGWGRVCMSQYHSSP